jgi:hypothetical protein
MADKKDKTKETKGGDQKKTVAKAPKAAAKKAKAPAAEAKKEAAEGGKKKRSREHPDAALEEAVS